MNDRSCSAGFTFVDVEAQDGAAFSDGPPLPARAERESLQPRDGVKLLTVPVGSNDAAATSPGAAVYAEVMEVLGGGGYRGWVEEAPASGPGPRVDQVVEFGPEHVSAIAKHWPFLEETKIVVGIKVHELELRPALVYREQPRFKRDSGWRAFVGDETDAELYSGDDEDTMLPQMLAYFLGRWPEVAPLVHHDAPTGYWQWDDQATAYIPTERVLLFSQGQLDRLSASLQDRY